MFGGRSKGKPRHNPPPHSTRTSATQGRDRNHETPGTMGAAEPNGASLRRLGINYPQGIDAWGESLCAPVGEDGRNAVMGLCRSALRHRAEFLKFVWGDHSRRAERVQFGSFYNKVINRDEIPRRNLTKASGECTPAEFEDIVNLYARLGIKIDEILQRNITTRTAQGRQPQERHAQFPVPKKPFNEQTKKPNDRYWQLIFQLICWIRKSCTGNFWLSPARREREENQCLRAAVESLQGDLARSAGNARVSRPRWLDVCLAMRLDCSTQIRVECPDDADAPTTFEELKTSIRRHFGMEDRETYTITGIEHLSSRFGDYRQITNDNDFRGLLGSNNDQYIRLMVEHEIDRTRDVDREDRAYYPAPNERLMANRPGNDVFIPREHQETHRLVEGLKRDQEKCFIDANDPTDLPPPQSELGKKIRNAQRHKVNIFSDQANADALEEDVLADYFANSAKTRYSNVAEIEAGLRERFNNTPHSFFNRLPRTSTGDRGMNLSPVQQGQLLFQLDGDNSKKKGGIIADSMGTGKTGGIIAGIIGGYQQQVDIEGRTPDLPTLVVTATTVAHSMTQELHEALGGAEAGWTVYRLGNRWQPFCSEQRNIELKRSNEAYQGHAGKHVIVLSYEDLARMSDLANHPDVENLCERLICDEGHRVRFCELTMSGRVLRAFKAKFRWIFTGTPLVNSLMDFRGYVALLERPEFWAEHRLTEELPRPRDSSVSGHRNRLTKNADRASNTRPAANGNSKKRGRKGKTNHEADAVNDPLLAAANETAPFDGVKVYDQDLESADLRLRQIVVAAFNWWITPHAEHFQRHGDEDSMMQTLRRMQPLFDELVLCRSHKSKITLADGTETQVTPNLPGRQTKVINLKWDEDEADVHAQMTADIKNMVNFNFVADDTRTMKDAYPEGYIASVDEFEESPDDPAMPVKESIGSVYTKLVRYTTHLAFFKYRFRSTEKWKKKMRHLGLVWILKEMREMKVCNLHLLPEPTTDDEILQQVLKGSVKLRQLGIDVWSILNNADLDEKKRKVIVYTQSPQSAEFAHKLMGFLGIKSLLFSSTTPPEDRDIKVREQFNSMYDDDTSVLIVPFSLKMVGMNLHPRCANIICLEQPFNMSTYFQAIDRVHRRGQDTEQLIIRYHMPSTYMAVIEQQLWNKHYAISVLTVGALRELLSSTAHPPGNDDNQSANLKEWATLFVQHDMGIHAQSIPDGDLL